ncbi:MAG: anaerobic sulfatase maturase [Candidatus Heimdallarchaeota archaeon]
MKPFQLLIKPVSFDCNLRCTYCFYLRVENLYTTSKHPRMSYDTLERIISEFLGFRFKESIFGWQGGEPTLAGLNFFNKVVNFQQKYGESGQIIGNAFQTNGILINDEWCEFFNKFKFLVGLSLDGPKAIHDRYRKSKGEKSVWQKVMNAADDLRRNNVEFNILCVISRSNVNRVREIYDFFIENGFYYLQFIPALEIDQSGKRASFSINSSQYGKFLCELFSLWCKDPDKASIRLFSSILAYHHGAPRGLCVLEENCADYLLVEWNGDVYPCDFFAQEEERLGNLGEISLSELKNKRDNNFGLRKQNLSKECLNCDWVNLCHGGCLKDKNFPDNPHPDRSFYCEGYKKFFEFSNNWFLQNSK